MPSSAGGLASVTGFAEAAGSVAAARWTWDIKTVNAKGLDVRLRVPPGFDALEIEARKRIGARLARGTCHATLAVSRDAAPAQPRVNVALRAALVEALAAIPLPSGVGGATFDGLLGLRGVVEIAEEREDEAVSRRCASPAPPASRPRATGSSPCAARRATCTPFSTSALPRSLGWRMRPTSRRNASPRRCARSSPFPSRCSPSAMPSTPTGCTRRR